MQWFIAAWPSIRIGKFPQVEGRRRQKSLERGAGIILQTSTFSDLIPLAATETKLVPVTGSTVVGFLIALLQKGTGPFAGGQFRQGRLADYSHFSLGQSVKAAGIDAAVTFDYEIGAAAAGCRACAGRYPYCQLDIVVKRADAGNSPQLSSPGSKHRTTRTATARIPAE